MPASSRTDEEPAQTDSDPRPAASPETGDPEASDPVAADQAPADPVITAERDHLARSRRFLRLMREDVLSLNALGGDRVSEEYLKADLYRRAEALVDLPDTPLFFGRLDYRYSPWEEDPAAQQAGDSGGERFYIGRRHVHDPGGHPVVIDWRAPVSRPFYRASRAEPMGLDRRRRFGFSGGELTAYEDEDLAAPAGLSTALAEPGGAGPAVAGKSAAAPGDGRVSRILLDEIERPRSGPMRDIVATIQPDQDDIVRAGAEQSICVQGAPGTGKTAVGLHRIAYLLYAYRERMGRRGVLVIGPNRAFLSYIRNVLPALGETQVSQVTMADLVASATGLPVRGQDGEGAARIKGDARMAEVLRRALWARLAEPAEAIMLARGSRRWRVPVRELADLVAELRDRGVRYGAGREMLAHRIAHVVLTRMEAAGETCDDRTHEAVRRTRQVKAAVDAIWPKADPVRLVHGLLSDPGQLAAAAAGVLDEAEQRVIAWAAARRGPRSARWSAADLVLIDEAAGLIERTASVAHVVVDEAQDLSPMECRAIGRRCETGSATVLGDVAQGTSPCATASWPELLGHLGKADASLRVLDVGYRVPRQILDYAARLLGQIAPGLSRPLSLRQDPGALHIVPASAEGLDAALRDACRDATTRPGTVAVIAADEQVAALSRALHAAGLEHAVLDAVQTEDRITVVPATLAKGLEFDQVIVVEPASIAAASQRGLQRLYVALTRAVSRLTVLHAQPLPPALG
ncbi:MAG TPA: AAA family ATPase [Streptosporangiaceae bacterium]